MKISVTFDAARGRHVVSYLLPTSTPGRYLRRRRFFRSEEDALAERTRLRDLYRLHGPTPLRADPREIERVRMIEARLAGLATLEEAVEFYLKHRSMTTTPFMEDVVSRFLEAKEREEVGRRHLRTLGRYLLRLTRFFPAARVGDLTPEKLSRFFAQQGGPYGQGNAKRAAHNCLAWAVRSGLIERNPVPFAPISRPPKEEISVIPVPDLERLLRSVDSSRRDLLPFLVLKIFAGLRTSSVLRLTWEEIRFGEGILLPAAKAKARRRSYLEGFPPALWDWLAPVTRLSGRVARTHHPAEISAHAAELKLTLPRNGFRHSFASYHLAAFRDVSLTALLMAHRESPRVLWDHYNGVARGEDARRLFGLRRDMPGAGEGHAAAS